ncbi:DnaJ domain-containing protein [Acaryochloris sp. IP29b_bin.137]|uniref:J domain-containing protein n=1 Tax=Acaryochloris sp. IP29b_bin.137 TaxID=2969217 RepID=UPI00260CD1BA|nr:DnaJ domain-containing protein [Acaryochloris sp. IP29b_bin.137]
MDIADCYRLLQLTSRANIEDLKASYRRLARQWHPDINPGDEFAHEKFIQVTEAYKTLQKIVPPAPPSSAAPSASPKPSVSPQSRSRVKVSTKQSVPTAARPSPQRPKPATPPPPRTHSSPTPAYSPPPPPPQTTAARATAQESSLSSADVKLKVDSYKQLQELIQKQRFPRAVALIEALAQRLPQDAEVRQWQAIIYQSWGRQLIRERKLNQARAYLKKALNTDPHNKSLWAEIEQDFKKIEMVF